MIVLTWQLDCSGTRVKDNKMRLCFNQADYDGMRAFVKSQLTTVNYCEMSATVMWKHFNDIMQMAIDKFVPKRPSDSKKKKPLWMTGSVPYYRTVKKKHKLWKNGEKLKMLIQS